jgi:hypothetical protein
MPRLDDYRWLVTDRAEPWLRQVAADLSRTPPSPAYIRSLRNGLSESRAKLVLEQVQLRARARDKFSRADRLFFTLQGLEQATDDVLAAYKAERFAQSGMLADLCCGVGGDAMALGQGHAITIVDRDPISCLFACVNTVRGGASVERSYVEDVSAEHLLDCSAWHIDPDRRASGSRTSRVELGDPGVTVIDALLNECREAAVKLAPAAEMPLHWSAECEREWIETRGECRQQVAWFGRLGEAAGQHAATIVEPNGEASTFVCPPGTQLPVVGSLGKFLFDPSASLAAAGLVGGLAETLELSPLSSDSIYLTGDEELLHPHLQTFAVEEDLPFDQRKLRAHLQARHIGRLEIKKRGVDAVPETLRKQLALSGGNAATVILARTTQGVRAILGRRIEPAS